MDCQKKCRSKKRWNRSGRLREVGEFASDHGQVIRLEVHGTGTAFPPHIKTILDVANHPSVGACWNSNPTDLDGEGWDHNFNLLKDRILAVHMRDLFWRTILFASCSRDSTRSSSRASAWLRFRPAPTPCG